MLERIPCVGPCCGMLADFLETSLGAGSFPRFGKPHFKDNLGGWMWSKLCNAGTCFGQPGGWVNWGEILQSVYPIVGACTCNPRNLQQCAKERFVVGRG